MYVYPSVLNGMVGRGKVVVGDVLVVVSEGSPITSTEQKSGVTLIFVHQHTLAQYEHINDTFVQISPEGAPTGRTLDSHITWMALTACSLVNRG